MYVIREVNQRGHQTFPTVVSLTLSQTLNVRLFQKEFADDNFKFDENGGKLSERIDDPARKEEIARDEQFLLFSQDFKKDLYCRQIQARAGLAHQTSLKKSENATVTAMSNVYFLAKQT